MAAIEVVTRLRARSNEVTVHWAPIHQGVPGNEKVDEYAKAAADGSEPEDAVPDGYRWETRLSHMARVTTEAQARSTTQWAADRTGDPRWRYRPAPGRGLRRKLLRRAPKSVAGRYYQLLSCHAAIGPYLRHKIHKAVDDKCWWCGGGKQ